MVIHQVNIMTKGKKVINMIRMIKVINVAKLYKSYGLDHSRESSEKQKQKKVLALRSKHQIMDRPLHLEYKLYILILEAIKL